MEPVFPADAIARLLAPKSDLQWSETDQPLTVWNQSLLIDNEATRILQTSLIEQEGEQRRIIRDQIEGILRQLPSGAFRSWMADYDFMAKMLTAEQLVIYAPAFVQLSFLMPVQLKFCRRRVVLRYLEAHVSCRSKFVLRQCRKFARSSTILYSAQSIFKKAALFAELLSRNSDQSVQANRRRVIMAIRELQLMGDDEIVACYRTENSYLGALNFFKVQCRYYRIGISNIYDVSTAELRDYLGG